VATARSALEGREARELPPGERVALDILHAALDFALGPNAVGRACTRCHRPVAAELEQCWREPRRTDRAVRARNEAARAVAQEHLRGAAEPAKRRGTPVEPLGGALTEEGIHEHTPRVAERRWPAGSATVRATKRCRSRVRENEHELHVFTLPGRRKVRGVSRREVALGPLGNWARSPGGSGRRTPDFLPRSLRDPDL
jgi:hypothetical protein